MYQSPSSHQVDHKEPKPSDGQFVSFGGGIGGKVSGKGFEDPEHPEKVYRVVKALYGLHQAPRKWYETLATYL